MRTVPAGSWGAGRPVADRLWLVSRPLATDEHRAHFWVRHLQLGVLLTEFTAATVMAYVVVGDRPHRTLLVAVGVGVMAATPLLLLLPMDRLARDFGCLASSVAFFRLAMSRLNPQPTAPLVGSKRYISALFPLYEREGRTQNLQ